MQRNQLDELIVRQKLEIEKLDKQIQETGYGDLSPPSINREKVNTIYEQTVDRLRRPPWSFFRTTGGQLAFLPYVNDEVVLPDPTYQGNFQPKLKNGKVVLTFYNSNVNQHLKKIYNLLQSQGLVRDCYFTYYQSANDFEKLLKTKLWKLQTCLNCN